MQVRSNFDEPDVFWIGFGSASSVSDDPPDEDRAAQVRRIAEEVTGRTFERPARSIGFLSATPAEDR